MTAPSASPSLLAVVPAALSLAAAHPASALPCPGCGSVVNAPNLAGHLHKVHDVPVSMQPGPGTQAFTLSGSDGRTWKAVVAVVLLWFLGLLGVMAWRTPVPPLALGPLGITAVALGLLIVLEAQGKLRTQLHVDGQRLVLRGVFGVGQRVLTLPASVESGRRIQRRPAPPGLSHENEVVDHDAGAYLRLTSGGVALTILGERAPGLANHWHEEGWVRGPQRRAHDVRVSAVELVQLTLHLAALGLLKPKPAKR